MRHTTQYALTIIGIALLSINILAQRKGEKIRDYRDTIWYNDTVYMGETYFTFYVPARSVVEVNMQKPNDDGGVAVAVSFPYLNHNNKVMSLATFNLNKHEIWPVLNGSTIYETDSVVYQKGYEDDGIILRKTFKYCPYIMHIDKISASDTLIAWKVLQNANIIEHQKFRVDSCHGLFKMIRRNY